MQRHVRNAFTIAGLVALATLTLTSCGSDAAPRSTPGTLGENSGAHGSSASTPPASEPSGRLTLDGQTWNLKYDADDPNATCQVIAANTVIVSGMRTPNGNRVDLHGSVSSPSKVSAAYFDDNERPSQMASADVSSETPQWSIDGSTVRLSGPWAQLGDLSQPEVWGELEITC